MADSPRRDLQTFLFDFVESEEDLRVLAWFRQLEAGGIATASDVVNATGVPELAVREVLDRLVAKRLLEPTADTPVAFRYAPLNSEFSATLDAVLERYGWHPLDVLRIMSTNSIERVTLAALRALAEGPSGRGPKQD